MPPDTNWSQNSIFENNALYYDDANTLYDANIYYNSVTSTAMSGIYVGNPANYSQQQPNKTNWQIPEV